jgi:hypothetical protein
MKTSQHSSRSRFWEHRRVVLHILSCGYGPDTASWDEQADQEPLIHRSAWKVNSAKLSS